MKLHTELELTNHCNTRCLHCPHEMISRPKGQMDWLTYETVVRKIRAYAQGQEFSLSFSGMGEPLLNPNIYRFIEHVSSDAYTGFSSNGSALTKKNVKRLIQAGLDVIYFSFNGDEPELFARMMGGLSFDSILDNLRRAIQLAQGTRLQIKANISVTKANRERLSSLRNLMQTEGVVSTTISMCHSRGGSLRDPAVFDTPPPPEDDGHCEVLKNTLFVDWRGQAFICDHDIHGEHPLGDLLTESLESVLERRDDLVKHRTSFRVCSECHDLLKFGFYPLESGSGGDLSEWIYDIYRTGGEGLSEATQSLKWLYEIYQKEGRVDRLVNRLLSIEKVLQRELATTRSECARKDKQLADLETILRKERQIRGDRTEPAKVRRPNVRRRPLDRLRRRATRILGLLP
jgi:hypothetical protein